MTELARVEAKTLNGIEVVCVAGEIDLSNAAGVREALGAAIPDLPEVVVDLSDTEYLDSAGLSMLFRLGSGSGTTARSSSSWFRPTRRSARRSG